MIDISIEGEEQVIRRMRNIPPNVRVKLLEAVAKLSMYLQGYVVRNKLSGQVLKRRTGTLAASIQWRVEDTPSGVVGIVGSRSNESNPLKYARIHEYGFQGTVTVREHLRMQTMAWGRPINPVQTTVGTHSREMNMPERSFLRSSLRENEENIRAKLAKAIREGVQQR